MTYEVEIVGRATPKGRPSPIMERTAVTAKRTAVRLARKEVRLAWHERINQIRNQPYEVRGNVYAVSNGGRPMLIRQVFINEETAKNGWRKMLRDEEV